MMWTEEQDELLIETVKRYEWIYNQQHSSYKDTRKKENSWREIAEVIAPGIPENAKMVSSRWLQLRDKYRRYRPAPVPSGGGRQDADKATRKSKNWSLYPLMHQILDKHTSQQRRGADSFNVKLAPKTGGVSGRAVSPPRRETSPAANPPDAVSITESMLETQFWAMESSSLLVESPPRRGTSPLSSLDVNFEATMETQSVVIGRAESPTRRPRSSATSVNSLCGRAESPTRRPPSSATSVNSLLDRAESPTRRPPSSEAGVNSLLDRAESPTGRPLSREAGVNSLLQRAESPTRRAPSAAGPSGDNSLRGRAESLTRRAPSAAGPSGDNSLRGRAESPTRRSPSAAGPSGDDSLRGRAESPTARAPIAAGPSGDGLHRHSLASKRPASSASCSSGAGSLRGRAEASKRHAPSPAAGGSGAGASRPRRGATETAWQDRLVSCMAGDKEDEFNAFSRQLAIVMRRIPKRDAYHMMTVNLDMMRELDTDD